jgi:segregation and condensation protein B
MNDQDLKHIIEATLLAAGRPVTTQQLLELFDERERPSAEQMAAALSLLGEDYAPRGVELIEVASGWRIQVKPRCADVVARLWQERPSRYSRALLETLALVAYRQPITRSEIEQIRGVSISSTIMRTLQERNWIRVVGHREVPGRPELLGTTREFLDYFGLKSLDQLPTLAELKDVENIGVQLELPDGDLPAETAASAEPDPELESSAETVAERSGASEPAEVEVASDDSPEEYEAAANDGDESDDDADTAPTLVAADDYESHVLREPPHEE